MRYARFLLVTCAPCIMFGQFGELKKLAASNSGHYSAAEAQSVAVELLRPLTPDRGAVLTLAHWLAGKQLDWQDGRTGPLQSAKLLASVNRELGLESVPELQLHEDELRNTRAFLRDRVPALIGDASGGQMAPFEAYFSMEWLIRTKMAGVPIPTPASQPAEGQPAPRLTARLTMKPYNPGDRQFMAKVIEAWSKWPTAAAGLRTLEKVFDDSQ